MNQELASKLAQQTHARWSKSSQSQEDWCMERKGQAAKAANHRSAKEITHRGRGNFDFSTNSHSALFFLHFFFIFLALRTGCRRVISSLSLSLSLSRFIFFFF
ncbi:hypothetical protein I3843_01G025600 [Carya illinoinensis]|nr:hypothetical protein I3843_01G025600 [Carya illinoinensis]